MQPSWQRKERLNKPFRNGGNTYGKLFGIYHYGQRTHTDRDFVTAKQNRVYVPRTVYVHKAQGRTLKYVWADLTTKLIQHCEPSDFMEHYVNGTPLTEALFAELGIFDCSLQEAAEGLCAALQTA